MTFINKGFVVTFYLKQYFFQIFNCTHHKKMKRLPKAEFNYENCYIRFQSVTEQNPQHYLVLPANDKWENIRYSLEKSCGCFKFSLPQKVVQNSYIVGRYLFSVIGLPPDTEVSSKSQIYGGDILLVKRVPQPVHMHAYIPSKYWSDLGDVEELADPQVQGQTKDLHLKQPEANETEEQKLERLLNPVTSQSQCFLPPIVVRLLKQHVMHPCDYPSPLTPHPLFVCKYCNQQGKHFQRLCPYTDMDSHGGTAELLTKVRRITGIPKSRLRPATEEEISLGQYYLSENNEKVVVLKVEHSVAPTVERKQNEESCETVFEYTVSDLLMTNEEFENQFTFSFEPYIQEMDEKELAAEERFYVAHPELRKKKNQICTHYYRGMCHKGKLECEFLHTGDANYIAICQFFMNGQCTNGDNCEFRHPPKHVFNNSCNAFKAGFCEKGLTCKYKHVKYKSPALNSDLSPGDVELMTQVLALQKMNKNRFVYFLGPR